MSERPLDSAQAEARRREPLYQLLQRMDAFLHGMVGAEAEALHADVHEAAFAYVTNQAGTPCT